MTVQDHAVHTLPDTFFDRHEPMLGDARSAIRARAYWSAFSELPKAYGEEAPAAGKAAFEALLGGPFELDQPTTGRRVGDERSPYGFALGVTYPHADADLLLAAAAAALPSWRDAGPRGRAGVLLEMLARINARSFELAHAVMHTSGQAFPMAFQAGGPHAQDRALEALAHAYEAMAAIPEEAPWEKPQGKRPPLRMRTRFTVVGRGVGLLIGCNTFPTWNGYPGLFASLATGNAVIVKPSRRAVLPLAITVAIAREVLAEAGLDPNVVTLAVDGEGERMAGPLSQRDEVRIIDFTGSTAFGDQLEREAPHAVVFTEKAGVNCTVVDSTDDYRGMLANLAFTLSLYSGQMCTTTQNVYVPAGGIATDAGHKSFDEVGRDLAAAVEGMLSDPARATGLLGAIVGDGVLGRLERAGDLGEVVLASTAVAHPEFPDATVRTPTIVAVDGPAAAAAQEEQFGPITLLVPTVSTADSLHAVSETIAAHGALTFGVYSTDEAVLATAEQVSLEAGVALSCNLTGGVYVNQSAAYSDFHGSGLNPAANASLSDLAFVTPRFHVVQSRRHAPAQGDV
jgi:phenylacetic acid degradation protein paaN